MRLVELGPEESSIYHYLTASRLEQLRRSFVPHRGTKNSMIDDNKLLQDICEINSDGSVTLKGNGFAETWRPWGHTSGFGVDGCKVESYNGALAPLLLTQILMLRDVGGPLRQISDSIPDNVHAAASKFLHWPVEHLQLAECHPQGYIQLADQNPALLNYMASLSASHTLWGAKKWGELLGHSQKYIGLQLSLPPGCVSYFSRIRDTSMCCHGYLEMALTAYKQIGMARLLTHVPHITLDVILLAFNHWKIVRACPSLLHIASELPTYSTLVCEDVAAISDMRRASRRPTWPWRKIRGLNQLRQIRNQLTEEAIQAGRGDYMLFPPPPVSPCSDWHAITNSKELYRHANLHKNCAMEQGWKLLSGKMALYESRHSSPLDTVIVVLAKGAEGWRVEDVLGHENALVEEDTRADVTHYFTEALSYEK